MEPNNQESEPKLAEVIQFPPPMNPAPSEAADNLAAAAEALIRQVIALTSDADFKSIMLIAQAHNFIYKGPDIQGQMQALDAAITAYKSGRKG